MPWGVIQRSSSFSLPVSSLPRASARMHRGCSIFNTQANTEPVKSGWGLVSKAYQKKEIYTSAPPPHSIPFLLTGPCAELPTAETIATASVPPPPLLGGYVYAGFPPFHPPASASLPQIDSEARAQTSFRFDGPIHHESTRRQPKATERTPTTLPQLEPCGSLSFLLHCCGAVFRFSPWGSPR